MSFSPVPCPAKLWGEHDFTAQNDVQLSELWTNQQPSEKPLHRIASISIQGDWSYHKPEPSASGTCLLQIIWIPNLPKQGRTELSISQESFARIVDHCGLESPASCYQNCYAGTFECLPTEATADGRFTSYCFSYHPKLSVVWREDIIQGAVTAMVLATEAQLLVLRDLLDSEWLPWRHAMFPAYFIACLLGKEIDATHHGLKDKIRAVEVRTKHHGLEHRHEPAAMGNWGVLSAQTSGYETKLAATSRKIRVLDDLLDFIGGRCSTKSHGAGATDPELNSVLSHRVADQQRQLKMRLVDNDYTLERARVQKSAILSLIAQKDATGGLEIARQSYFITLWAQRNSAAMRTLAIVTMIFLPGTFVAAVFSMPLFDWESNEHVLLPKFGIFWAVAIPLTLVTLLIYWVWSSWYARRNEHQVQRDAEAAKERGFELTPVSGRAWTDATFKTE